MPYIKGLYFNFVISNEDSRVELYFNNSQKDYNKKAFDCLEKNKEAIESNLLPDLVVWERLSDKTASRIAIRNADLKPKDESDWKDIFEWFKNTMPKLINVLTNYKNEINKL